MAWTDAARAAALLARKRHVTMYHGTHIGAKEGIKQHGLVAGGYFKKDGRVFLTPVYSQAVKYAEGIAKLARRMPLSWKFPFLEKLRCSLILLPPFRSMVYPSRVLSQ